mgnify:CR=1 FL=1
MNTQLFDIYKASDRGRDAIALFNPDVQEPFKAITSLINYAKKQWGLPHLADTVCDFIDIIWANIEHFGAWQGEITREKYADFIENLHIETPDIDEEGNCSFPDTQFTILKQSDHRAKAQITLELSILLYYQCSPFKPMLLPHRHDIFTHRI